MHRQLCYRTIAAILFTCTLFPAAAQTEAEIAAMKKSLQTEKNDTAKMLILSDLGYYYATQTPKLALDYARQQMVIAEHVSYPKFKANALNDMALALYYDGQYTGALNYNKKALAIREKIGDDKLIISSLNKIAVVYQEIGNYDLAAQNEFRVLKLAEKIKNDVYVGMTLSNIANLYRLMHRYEESIVYGYKGLALAKENKDTGSMANAYGTIAAALTYLQYFDSAVQYYKIAISYYEVVGAYGRISSIYNNIGLVYRGRNMDDSGVYYYKQALEIAKALENENDQAFYSANLGQALVDMNRPDEAYPYLLDARRLNQKANTLQAWKTLYSAFTDYYIRKKMPDSAYRYKELYTVIIDSIFSTDALRQVNELEAKYETEKKEQQIALQKLTIAKKNITIAVAVAALIAAIALGLLLYSRYRRRQEAKLQAEIIHQQDIATKAIIEAEEHERKRIAGDLHDGVGQMFSAVKMNLSGLADRVQVKDANDQALLNKTLDLVDESCKEVRVIAHQMMPNILLKSGLASAIRDFIEKLDTSRLKINLETSGLDERLPSDVETVLYRVIQESVNNVIKHAQASSLDIQLHKDGEGINATIEDNGVGFDTVKSDNFEGIGLKNIITRVEYLKGTVEFDSALGKGTVVAIFIPHNG